MKFLSTLSQLVVTAGIAGVVVYNGYRMFEPILSALLAALEA